jgi:hypothetical protein
MVDEHGVEDGDMIVVWVSCGAASAVAAMETKRLYAERCSIRYVNSPVIEEDPDNIRFMSDLSAILGAPIERAVNPKYPHGSAVKVWDARKGMAFPHGAPCTKELKKEPRYHWTIEFKPDWHVLGFTSDEQKRHDRFVLTEIPNVLPVLIDANISKARCFDILKKVGLKRPAIYERGYPNANCIGCVKATSPTYWNLVRAQDLEVFRDRAEQSRRLGAKLVRYQGKRLFLDELPINAKGRSLKNWHVECGLFCEETVDA